LHGDGGSVPYRSESEMRAREVAASRAEAAARMGATKAASSGPAPAARAWESRKPRRRSASACATMASPCSSAASAPKRREWRRRSRSSASFLQFVGQTAARGGSAISGACLMPRCFPFRRLASSLGSVSRFFFAEPCLFEFFHLALTFSMLAL